MYVDQFGISGTGSGDASYGCHISLSRVVLVGVVSWGLYWFYWMYRTWAQYRDHTAGDPEQAGQTHYPVWHGLTQLVPVYGFFRFHAHVRSYKALLQERGVTDSLNIAALVTVVVINLIVGLVAGGMRGESTGPGVTAASGIGFLISLATLLVSIGVICKVQSNLNQYWAAVAGTPAQNARFGKGEILCLVIGALFWLGVISDFVLW